jgi:hypothetical protein
VGSRPVRSTLFTGGLKKGIDGKMDAGLGPNI